MQCTFRIVGDSCPDERKRHCLLFSKLCLCFISCLAADLLVQLCACRDPVVYEQEIEHLFAVILVDRADQHSV